MIAADARAAAQNRDLSVTLEAVHRGHLVAQKVRWQIQQGDRGDDLVKAARTKLADDPAALGAFLRGLAREGRQ